MKLRLRIRDANGVELEDSLLSLGEAQAKLNELFAASGSQLEIQEEPESHVPYRYVINNDYPLLFYPGCGHDFTAHGGIIIECVDDRRHLWTVGSRLDEHGRLHDPTGDMAAGNHSRTLCGTCGEMLINFGGVKEMRPFGPRREQCQ